MINRDIYFNIERLVNFSIKKELIDEIDSIYIRNSIYEILCINGKDINEGIIDNTKEINNMREETNDISNEELDTCTEIIENIALFAIENNLIGNSITEIDLLTTKIMGLVTPRPSVVKNKFFELYEISKKSATDYFYKLSKDSNYIMVGRVSGNVEWVANTQYGEYMITINVSKPEKTPEDIAKAKLLKSSGYPKCLLCKENVGFQGNINHPPRQNLRTIPILLNNEKWQMQYSPYVYYNEHCIIFNEEHTQMQITNETFIRLLDFVDFAPHYFIGSNADLPIVGGSILSHDHFQGGNFELPMAKAEDRFIFTSNEYVDVKLSILNWAMSVIRLKSKNKKQLLEVANMVLAKFKGFNAENIEIISHTENEIHNTITPIARLNKNCEYELDLVLRNNRTNKEYPHGIFHTHEETHHIKKENIGLIEVMGLAVMPKRLITEFDTISKYLKGETTTNYDEDDKHYSWAMYLIEKYGTDNNEEKIKDIFETEICKKFENCLIDCGIFKNDIAGNLEFKNFVKTLGFSEIKI